MREPFSVVVLLALIPWATVTATAPAEVAISVDASGGVRVPVGINGQGPFTFLLDTGSSHTVVGSDLADRLGLPVVARTSVLTSAGVDMRLVVKVLEMTIGSAAAVDLTPSVVSSDQLRAVASRIDGIVGQDFLTAFDYTVDYRRKRLRWIAEAVGDRDARLPLVRAAERWLVQLPGNGREAPVLMVPDSGSEGLVIFERNGRTPVLVDYTSQPAAVFALAGQRIAREAVVGELRVGPVTLRNQPAVVLRRDDADPAEGDGLLPLHLFSSVSFNTRKGYLAVRR